MNLTELKIATIQNLKFIHVYELESNFDESTNKYIGMRISYNGTEQLDLSYRDEQFEQYVTKVLEKYAEEKSGGNIILLGDLTRKFFSESTAILDKKNKTGNQSFGLPAFNPSTRLVKRMDAYLKEAIKTILLVYKKYEFLDMKKISGLGNKYVMHYNIGTVPKKMPITISKNSENQLSFTVGAVDGSLIAISGNIVSEGGSVYVDWNSDDQETKGELIFESQTGIMKRKVESNGTVILYDETKNTILEKDLETILFYSEIFDIEDIKKFRIIKPANNSFLLGHVTSTKEKEESLILTISGIQMDLEQDETTIVLMKKDILSQHKGSFNKALSDETEELTLKKIQVDSKTCVLLERKCKNSTSKATFSYDVYEVESDVDLRKPFTYTKNYKVDDEVKNLESVKEYIRKK